MADGTRQLCLALGGLVAGAAINGSSDMILRLLIVVVGVYVMVAGARGSWLPWRWGPPRPFTRRVVTTHYEHGRVEEIEEHRTTVNGYAEPATHSMGVSFPEPAVQSVQHVVDPTKPPEES